MFSRRALPALAARRLYSTETPAKPSIKLVAELRKLTEVSITKAREALSATNNDVQAAYKWLQDDLVASGAKKAAKLEGRATQQGLVGVSVLSNSDGKGKFGRGVRAAMVEVNCETDFVGRNARFDALVADIAHTAAFIAEAEDSSSFFKPVPLELLQDAPLITRDGSQSEAQGTIGSVIHDSIARFGERIQLRRAVSVVHTPSVSDIRLRLATYSHGSVGIPTQGQIGTLAVLALRSPKLSELFGSQEFLEDLSKLERSLGRQIVGFPTTSIRSPSTEPDEGALYDQEFMMYPAASGATVSHALQQWAQQRGLTSAEEAGTGLEVMEFLKWTVGESA
ncbi:elongation factor TS-domain-containing protein [Irpex lacteus]|nr:elongation factor TS-domain-containing protein [Irpex lacteus]